MKSGEMRREGKPGDGHWSGPAAASDRIAFIMLSLFLLFGSLPHGLVSPAGRFALQLFSFSLAALVSIGSPGRAGKPAGAVIALLMILAGIGLLQALPLANGVVDAVSPASARIYHESETILKNSGRASGSMRLSIAPRRTLESALGVLACAAILFSSAILARTSRRRRIIAGSLVTGALIQLLYVVAIAQPGRIRGTLVVTNNFAALLAIAFATAGAFALAERSRSPVRALFFMLSTVAIGVGLVWTRSTGGLAAAVFSLGLVFAVDRLRGRIRPATAFVLSLIAPLAGLAATLLFAVKGTALLSYLPAGPLARETSRVVMWSSALETWLKFPWLGAGLGAFEDALRSPSISHAVAHPHNEVLHLAVTGGIAGLAVAAAAVIVAWKNLVRGAFDAPDNERAMALSALGALCAITLHGLVDFPLAIPAIAATLAIVVGAGLGSTSRDSRELPASFVEGRRTVYSDPAQRS